MEDTTTGVLLLGLYGMPGLGKTTMSKALCDYFHSDMVGRVCRVDLGGSSTNPLVRQKEELKRQKEVLKQLWGFKNDVLDTLSDVDQVIQCDANDFRYVMYMNFRDLDDHALANLLNIYPLCCQDNLFKHSWT